jgi:Family of unknown function (DUF6165)
VRTIFRRDSADRNANACREQQHRGACYVRQDNDDAYNDDADDDHEGDDDNEHRDDHEGDDDDESDDIGWDDDSNSDCHGHHHFKQHLIGSRSDRSDPKSGDDDRLNGFDEIVTSNLLSAMQIRAPISVGELIDKITILQIKLERLDGPGAGNVAKELAVLSQAKRDAHLNVPEIGALMVQLKIVNVELWDIEDQIRQLEARKDFGPRFIETARSVYRLNDRRAAIKRLINVASNSDIIEEKNYRTAHSIEVV